MLIVTGTRPAGVGDRGAVVGQGDAVHPEREHVVELGVDELLVLLRGEHVVDLEVRAGRHERHVEHRGVVRRARRDDRVEVRIAGAAEDRFAVAALVVRADDFATMPLDMTTPSVTPIASTTPGPENRPPWRLSPVNVALVIVTPWPAISWASALAFVVLRSTTDHVAADTGDPSLMVMNPAAAIAADRVTRNVAMSHSPSRFPALPRALWSRSASGQYHPPFRWGSGNVNAQPLLTPRVSGAGA